MVHGAHICQMTQKKYMIYLIILKFQKKERSAFNEQHNCFFMEDSVCSVY